MNRRCPICKEKLSTQHMTDYVDYFCNAKDNSHHYSDRLVKGQKTMMKIRVTGPKDKLFLMVNYKDKYSEIWEGAESARIRVDQIVNPNYDDMEALANKIKTYLVFS